MKRTQHTVLCESSRRPQFVQRVQFSATQHSYTLFIFPFIQCQPVSGGTNNNNPAAAATKKNKNEINTRYSLWLRAGNNNNKRFHSSNGRAVVQTQVRSRAHAPAHIKIYTFAIIIIIVIATRRL